MIFGSFYLGYFPGKINLQLRRIACKAGSHSVINWSSDFFSEIFGHDRIEIGGDGTHGSDPALAQREGGSGERGSGRI